MEYQDALIKAERIKADFAPWCNVIEIAGSVRRQKPTGIKDIEIVCIPKPMTRLDMFGEIIGFSSLLEDNLFDYMFARKAFFHRNGAKWKTIVFPDTVHVDLFVVTAETWGTQFALKTGPALFSQWLVTPRLNGGALPNDARFVGEFNIEVNGVPRVMRTEQDFFDFCGIPMTDPADRVPPKNFKPRRR